MAKSRRRCESGGYEIRRYDPADENGVLALDELVWNRDRGADWFAWKYAENPYLDHVPVFVAERDGEIVGARPFMAFRLRAGTETALALQPADTMVHPDHRRQGLFTRMTDRAIEYYAEREPAFFFNFPNEQSYPGYLKLGWRRVGRRTTFYRVQRPGAFAVSSGALGRTVERAVAPLARTCYDVCDRTARASRRFTVERHRGVPADLLASLYERRVPDELHALRNAEFYRWRFGGPMWDRRTYVAARGGERVAALVVRSRTTRAGINVVQLAELEPSCGGPWWRDASARLFEAAVGEHADADLLSVAVGGLTRRFLARRGFLADDRPPLASLTKSRSTLVVRPTSEFGEWSLNGRDLTRRDSWQLSFAERDTT
jgi:GNAT superfamily N-acetyltransferase